MYLKSSLFPLVLLFFLFVVDISVILNIPIFRQILSFVYFTIILGYMILLITKIDKNIDILDKILFSVGVSVSLLMFIGTALSIVGPLLGIVRPLSSVIILVILNIVSLCLIFILFLFNFKTNFKISFSNIGNSEFLFIIVPIIFPFMAIAGTKLLDTYGDNRLTMIFIILIYIYCIFLYLFLRSERSGDCDFIYFINIYSIGLSTLLMYSTCSNYLVGYNDSEIEYYLFIKTLLSRHWSPLFLYSPYNACMSVSVLPAIYQILTNVDSLIIFKIVLQFIVSLFPVAVFSIVRKFNVDDYTAYILALMCVFQYQYILKLSTHLRTGIGLFFFCLVIISLMCSTLPEIFKRSLILVFMVSLVLSHYTTAYLTLIFFIIVMLIWIILTGRQIFLTKIIFLFVVLLFWYALIVRVAYSFTVEALRKIVINMSNLFLINTRGESTLKSFGYGVSNFPQLIKVVTYDLFYGLMVIGILVMVLKKLFRRETFDLFDIFKISMLVMFIGSIILPFATKIYSIARLSLQMLTILIVGIYYFVELFPIIRKYKKLWVISLLGLLVFSGTGLNYVLLGVPVMSPMYLSKKSAYRDFMYVYNGEIAGGGWLDKYGDHKKVVYGDFVIDSRIFLSTLSRNNFIIGIIGNKLKSFHLVESYRYFNIRGAMKDDYLYLRFFNIKYNKIYDGQSVHYSNGTIAEEKNMLVNINSYNLIKIYDNSFSQLYIFTKRVKPINS